MLRVRPILHTPHAAEWSALFTALGLGEIVVAGSERASTFGVGTGRCFAAGAGRIMLHESSVFGTELGFEVRDVRKFAKWTINDGTPVLLRTENAGNESVTVADIVAPDGVAFSARPVDVSLTAGTPESPAPDPQSLAVVTHWATPDVPGTLATLANIGAKAETGLHPPGASRYRAKHGGFVEVREHSTPGMEFALRYAGEVSALVDRLVQAGQEVLVRGRGRGRGRETTLLADHPDGGLLRIACVPISRE